MITGPMICTINETWRKAFPYAIQKYVGIGGRAIVAVSDSKEDLNPAEFADEDDRHPKLIDNPNYDKNARLRFEEALSRMHSEL